jgi:hypothetical protein
VRGSYHVVAKPALMRQFVLYLLLRESGGLCFVAGDAMQPPREQNSCCGTPAKPDGRVNKTLVPTYARALR